ncbi:alpha/beta-hydrolase [Bimuria novae-zelandiae CBS 107.79]|uniref:Alpha/beta-hydrolase n=1 Tax=Bimuria novae-zelandiae CBS 107.79 TaxID=1447943 RepID=A0A6A5VLR1_9PLEO|nr:alpha/beta-hydrolase [Bimuria novae-zelandiae CBS 107.79]
MPSKRLGDAILIEEGVSRGSDKNTYVVGNNKDTAVMIVHDLFGWTFTNLRLLADHFAKEANVTVYLPDFFDDDVVDPETLDDPEKRAKFSMPDFFAKHSKDVRFPEIVAAAKELKSKYKKTAVIAYCWGVCACFRLGADPALVDVISVAHPLLVEKPEIDNCKVPVQIMAAEHDMEFTPELKEYTNKVIPTLGVPYEYIYFPGLVHGFAAKGDQNDDKQKDGLERSKNSAVGFFKEFLHSSS